MPLRPDFNLTRRPTAPVKLPRMNFPMVGGPVEQFQPVDREEGASPEPSVSSTVAEPQSRPESGVGSEGPGPGPGPGPVAVVQPAATRVIVYGRSGCYACMEAVQDLIDRQMSFIYYDVNTDAKAMEHLQAISVGPPVVPVIVQIGYGGTSPA